MNLKHIINEITDNDFDKEYRMSDISKFAIRRASRGILIRDKAIALLNVTKFNYHKLPGGGIENNESLEVAFKRELVEEVGCDCEIVDQGGIVLEWRDQMRLLQISYVFLAKVVGEIRESNLEQGEIDDGFQLEWVSFEKIKEVIEKDTPANYEGNFIKLRDKSIIEYYENKLV